MRVGIRTLAIVSAFCLAAVVSAAERPDGEPPAVQDQLNEVAERICEQLDWDRPELQAVAAVREADGARAAADRPPPAGPTGGPSP